MNRTRFLKSGLDLSPISKVRFRFVAASHRYFHQRPTTKISRLLIFMAENRVVVKLCSVNIMFAEHNLHPFHPSYSSHPSQLFVRHLEVRSTRSQVKLFVVGNLNAPCNSLVLERQSWLASLEVKSVRAQRCSRAQPPRGAQPFTVSIYERHTRVRGCLTLTIAANAARTGRFSGLRTSRSRPFRYSAHASNVAGCRTLVLHSNRSGWRMF